MRFQGLKLPFLSASARDFNRSQQSCLEGGVCKHITLLALGNGATNKKYCEPWLSSFLRFLVAVFTILMFFHGNWKH